MENYALLVNITKILYKDFSSVVVCENNRLSESFPFNTGVKQGCILSPFLFIMAIDWLMATTMKGKQRGIHWPLTSELADLDYADDLHFLSSCQKRIQSKWTDIEKSKKMEDWLSWFLPNRNIPFYLKNIYKN